MYNEYSVSFWTLFVVIVLEVFLILQEVYYLGKNKETTLNKQFANELWRQDLQKLLNCKNRPLHLERLQHGDYWVIQNLVVGEKSRKISCAESITFTTQSDLTSFGNLEILVKRWLAPISFAIYAPGQDLSPTLDAIQYVRNCLPDSELIVDYVTFHIFFPNGHMPAYVPLIEAEALDWPYSCLDTNGTLALPPYAQLPRSALYRVQKNLTYPINVGRNIARKAANTHFIFACDIELYPSLGFVEQFMDMVNRSTSVWLRNSNQLRRIYAVPVFEIAVNETVPNYKSELLTLLKQKGVNYNASGKDDWIQSSTNNSKHRKLFGMESHTGFFQYWESFYISDKMVPLFDERVTWKGEFSKRIQAFAMCLMGYEYQVLHFAFLIRSVDSLKNRTTSDFILAQNSTKFIKSTIEPEYHVMFGENKNCNL